MALFPFDLTAINASRDRYERLSEVETQLFQEMQKAGTIQIAPRELKENQVVCRLNEAAQQVFNANQLSGLLRECPDQFYLAKDGGGEIKGFALLGESFAAESRVFPVFTRELNIGVVAGFVFAPDAAEVLRIKLVHQVLLTAPDDETDFLEMRYNDQTLLSVFQKVSMIARVPLRNVRCRDSLDGRPRYAASFEISSQF